MANLNCPAHGTLFREIGPQQNPYRQQKKRALIVYSSYSSRIYQNQVRSVELIDTAEWKP